MKGVLVVPNVAMHGWNTYHREGRRYNSLPHGLLSIATELQRNGHDISVVDLRQFPSMEKAVRAICKLRPEFVGCGPMTVDFQVMVDLFRAMKKSAPSVTTVAGGVHVSVATADAEAISEIDYIVKGEAEWTMAAMADSDFVGFKRVTKGVRPVLDYLLPINRELADYRGGELMHGASWHSSYPYITVMVGRGCPYPCAFCAPVSETLFGSGYRMRSVAHVMQELGYLMHRYDPRYIEFIDDTLTLSPRWMDLFIEEYPKACGKVPFNIASRVDAILRSKDQIVALREIGLDAMNVGFESGCDRHLKFLKKNTTAAENIEAGKFLKSLGLKIIANVIFGIPGETPKETLETVKMLREMKADYPSPAFLTPYPGCSLHEKLGDRLLPQSYADMHRHATTPKMSGVDYAAIKTVLVGEGLM